MSDGTPSIPYGLPTAERDALLRALGLRRQEHVEEDGGCDNPRCNLCYEAIPHASSD